MKIFALQFALHLRTGETPRDALPVSEILDRFNGPEYGGEELHSPSGPLPGLARRVMEIHTDPRVQEKRTAWNLWFETEEAMQRFAQDYASRFYPIAAAGGAVLYPGGNSILLIHRKGFWDLPKGKLEEGEEIRDAAWREVEEETGIHTHEIIEDLTPTYHIYQTKNKWVLKTTFWYLMRAVMGENPKPQEEEDILIAEWVPVRELEGVLPDAFPLIAEVIREAMSVSNAG